MEACHAVHAGDALKTCRRESTTEAGRAQLSNGIADSKFSDNVGITGEKHFAGGICCCIDSLQEASTTLMSY